MAKRTLPAVTAFVHNTFWLLAVGVAASCNDTAHYAAVF